VIGLAALLIAAPLGGTHLAPDPEPPPVPAATIDAPAPLGPASPAHPLSGPILVGGGGVVLAAGAALATRRRPVGGQLFPESPPAESLSPGAALGLEPPADALVVFVPGHGNGPEVFDDLIDNMELDEEQVRYFDYRLATSDGDVHQASQRASIDDAADALNGYLAGLAEAQRPIYVIGFSKGGAATAELIARWDDGGAGAASSVRGAVLLDPPLAGGPHGSLQSVGRLIDFIPDDGGYDPIDCAYLGFLCEDDRDFLGRTAGVDTVVIRNPESPVTSFNDLPDGLRVYDARDGRSSVWSMLARPWQIPSRLGDAHTSVLANPAVADCIVAEMNTPGSCQLPPTSPSSLFEVFKRGLQSLVRFRPPLPFWG